MSFVIDVFQLTLFKKKRRNVHNVGNNIKDQDKAYKKGYSL